MESVIPDIILWKESGLWMAFRNEEDFDKGLSITNQALYEPFNDFIKRTVKVFTDEEDNGIGLAEDMFPCVNIDYAIAECREKEGLKADQECAAKDAEISDLHTELDRAYKRISELEEKLNYTSLR